MLTRRVVVATLIISLGQSSAALAGETVLATATRVVREAARKEALPVKPVPTQAQRAWTGPTVAAKILATEPASTQEQGALATSGLRKRTKVLIYLGTALGLAASWYAIDHRVEDNTPSSHGLRED